MIMAGVLNIHEVKMLFIKDNHWGIDEMDSTIRKRSQNVPATGQGKNQMIYELIVNLSFPFLLQEAAGYHN